MDGGADAYVYTPRCCLHGCRPGVETVSVLGYSAGSMLTISMAARADDIDTAAAAAANTQRRAGGRADAGPAGGGASGGASGRFVGCCVAIHGPDKIADVFESFHRSW